VPRVARCPGRHGGAPWEPALHLIDLDQRLLGDRERLDEDADVAQRRRHDVHVLLVVDDDFGHEAVEVLDAALGEVAGEAEVLPSGATGDALRMRARTAHRRHHEVADAHARHGAPDLGHLAERFVTEDEPVGARRRRPVLERADLAIGPAHPDVAHPEHDVGRPPELRGCLLDDLHLTAPRKHGDGLHLSLSSDAEPSRKLAGGSMAVASRAFPRPSRYSEPMAQTDPRPLAGTTVIDMSRVLAGPFCTLVLAQLGARVIKVERRNGGDDARSIGPFVGGKSLYFAGLNHGKESIALDLRTDADRAVFERLLAAGDVLVENFRPGVLARLGYPWTTLHARWPRLVYAAVSGFGHTGPLRERPAFDMVVQAMGGIMTLTGYPDGPPARVGVSIGDITAGLFTAVGIEAALMKRRETGEGTMVDVAMLDCQLAILENALTAHLVTGAMPQRLGTRHPNISPFQAFEAADGRSLVVCAGHDNLFLRLCAAIERPELVTDRRFDTTEGRRVNAEALAAEVASVLRTRPAAEWLERLERAGVPCAPINTVADAVRLPQVAARHMVVEVSDPTIGALFVAGNPIKIDGMPDPLDHRPAPDLDADRAAILDWLREADAGRPERTGD